MAIRQVFDSEVTQTRGAQAKKRFLIIDGNSLLHRAYHALPPLTDKSGEVANAVFGFSNMLLKAIGEVKPSYVACAFDTAAPTFRHVEFEAYKAQRAAPPPDLYPQLPKVKKVLDAFGIAYFEKEGFEADDVIATLATRALAGPVASFPPTFAKASAGKPASKGSAAVPLEAKRSGVGSPSTGTTRKKTMNYELSTIDEVIILSGDRDVLQLVDGNIKAQMPGWNLTQTTLYGSKEVEEKFGVTPQQMVDYKSLIGDTSDNVPGIAGIGPKTAADLIKKYGSIEGIFKHLGEISESVRAKLEAGKETALAAMKLVELDRNVPIEIRVKSLEFRPNWEQVRKEYEELGFKSIAAKIPTNSSQLTVDGSQKDNTVNSEPKTKNRDQLELI